MERLRLLLAAAVAAFPFHPAHAEAWPTNPVRVIVAFSFGNATDVIARTLGQKLSPHLGQPFVVETARGRPRPGARAAPPKRLGAEAMPMTPDESDAYVRPEMAANAAVVKAAGINAR
jgi:tripartite-type tricarboxylate transporter receptor subunit TctC